MSSESPTLLSPEESRLRPRETALFADLGLARRLERAEADANARFVEARAAVDPERGACWIEVAGAYAMFDGPTSPLTQTFGLGMFAAADAEVIGQIETFFRERAAAVAHEVSPLAGAELYGELHRRGYQPIELSSVLVRRIAAEQPAASRGSSAVRARVAGAAEMDVWTDATVRGWSDFPEYRGFLEELGRLNPHRRDAYSFLAEEGGTVIAAGMLTIHGGVALLAGACTVPEARRRGAQLALLDERLRFAAECGCDLAMLCAQPGSASQRNAERHGFRVAYTRTKWQLRGTQ